MLKSMLYALHNYYYPQQTLEHSETFSASQEAYSASCGFHALNHYQTDKIFRCL